MADRDISTNYTGNVKPVLKNGQTIDATKNAVFQNIATLKTYLKDPAQGLPLTYTDAQLFSMTKNDLIFAARKKMSLA